MTLKEIRESDKEMLLPTDIAPVLKCNPHLIRLAARERPELLGFPVTVVGNRTKIPRKAFLAFLGESDTGYSPSVPSGTGGTVPVSSGGGETE